MNYTVYVIAGRAGTRDRVVYRFADEVEKDDDGYAPPPDVATAGDGTTLVFAADGSAP